MWEIKDKSGSIVRCAVGSLEYNGTWMGECYLTVTVESPEPIPFAIGDYIEYRGERFEINYDPTEIKNAARGSKGDAFKYEQIKFNSLSDELTRCAFLDYVKEDNQLHYTGLPTFSFFASSIQDLADRLQVNLDRLYSGTRRWLVTVNPEYVNKTDVNISVDKINVWDALNFVTTNFGANFIIRGRTIEIGTAGIPTDNLFKYGKGKGLASIKRQSESNQQIITRLRVYGSSDNMPTRYYNKLVDDDENSYIPNNMAINTLMLPGFPEETQDPYIDSPNIEALGIREGAVFFDGTNSELETVKPSIEGMTAEKLISAGIECAAEGALDEVVSAEQATDDGLWEDLSEGESIPNFEIRIKDVGFDINDYLSSETATISMKTGMLGGREFSILKCEKNNENGYTLTCSRVYDDSLRLYFPYNSYNIRPGDKFVLLHIEMPDVYIRAASQRLLELGTEYLSKVDYSRSSYSPEIDEIFMARQHAEAVASGGIIPSLHDNIKEGDIMLFEDEDLLLENASIVIDNLQIKEGEDKIPTYKVTLRNEKSVGSIQRLQNQIDAIVSGGQGGGYTASQIRQMINTYGKERFLSKVEPDKAQSVIRFLQGAEFGQHVGGMAGIGAAIDGNGNAEVESIVVRSFMKVYELIYNRLNAQEGNTSFADVGTIDAFTDNGDGTHTLTMRKRWDGDITAFQPGDVIYGYVNNLETSGQYYKAWAWVQSVDRAANTLTVFPYADDECPSGVNHPLTAGMVVTRWGNNIEATAATYANPEYQGTIIVRRGSEYRNIRQTSFYISCEDGNIVELMGVHKPILDPRNYSTVIGKIPDGLLDEATEELINKDQPYLFARGIIVQDLIRIDYQGVKTRTSNYRGEWDYATAISTDGYYRSTSDMYDTVTHNDCLWQCIAQGNTDEPGTSGAWVLMAGNSGLLSLNIWTLAPSANIVSVRANSVEPRSLSCTVNLHSTAGDQVFADNVSLLNAGARLYYSLDGIDFREFTIGLAEPLELEDGSGYIELEVSVDGDLYLTVGGDDINTADIDDRIYFVLKDADTGETLTQTIVPVVKDGNDGKEGTDGLMVYPAGYFDPMAEYSAEGNTTPVVMYNSEYFVLKRGKKYRGVGLMLSLNRGNPALDVANGGDDARWQRFDRFNAIFADIVMANFAKLGSAVFYGDWMISQQGVLADGITPSTNYEGFRDDAFIPDIAINFNTGEMTARNIKFREWIKPVKTVINADNYMNYIVNDDTMWNILNAPAFTNTVELSSTLNPFISTEMPSPEGKFATYCMIPSRIFEGQSPGLDDFVGQTIRIINNTAYNVGITGATCTPEDIGIWTSLLVPPGHEIILRCFFHYNSGEDVKQIGWIREYVGKQ